MPKRVLICGAGIAGPALAYWLGRSGYDVTVVERAPRLRTGGHAVDFRGPAHFRVLERMGVLAQLRELQTNAGAMRFISDKGRTRLFLPAAFAGGDLEIGRGDLARFFYEHSRPFAEYVFGDSIDSFEQQDRCVDVRFEKGGVKRFDLLIGADGIGSKTRRLLFGDAYESHLGYWVAGWDAPMLGPAPSEATLFNAPGRMIGLAPSGRGGPVRVFGIFAATASMPLDISDDRREQLRRIYSGMGWRVPEILRTLEQADDVFLSPLTRADPPNWYSGRVALVGDAASGVTIGGMGTGMAVIGAYSLAGELSLDPENPSFAFERYRQHLQSHVRAVIRSAAPGPFLAPRTMLGLWARNTLLSVPACQRWLIRESNRRTDVPVADYPDSPDPITFLQDAS